MERTNLSYPICPGLFERIWAGAQIIFALFCHLLFNANERNLSTSSTLIFCCRRNSFYKHLPNNCENHSYQNKLRSPMSLIKTLRHWVTTFLKLGWWMKPFIIRTPNRMMMHVLANIKNLKILKYAKYTKLSKYESAQKCKIFKI